MATRISNESINFSMPTDRMKYFIPILILCMFSHVLPAQHLSNIDVNKYSIRLPSYWKPGNKIWKILTDKLPLVCEEIKEKELCGDNCNPGYTIELEVYEPLALDHDYYCTNSTSTGPVRDWVFLTYYNFQSSLLLLNEKREVITRFIVVDTTETFMIRKMEKIRVPGEIIFRPSRGQISWNGPNNSFYLYTQSRILPAQIRYSDHLNPQQWVKENQHKLLPSDKELFAIIDQKIRSW